MLYFAEAYIAENGSINGKKGDQANEIRISKIYQHKLGWRKFRHHNVQIANAIGDHAIAIAKNQSFGYGQSDRNSGYNECKKANWNPSKVKTTCNLDCSRMVGTEIACAYKRDIQDFNTASEAKVLISLGFQEVFDGSQKHGDIWVTKSKGHTGTIVDVDKKDSSIKTNEKAMPDIIYKVKTAKGWLPEVVNDTDYAGIEGQKIYGFMARRSDGGLIKYRVSTLASNGFLDWATGYDENDYNNGYAGDNKNAIDEIEIKVDEYTYHYKTSPINSTGYYPEVSDDTCVGGNSYAGANGVAIDKVQIRKG